MRSAFLTHVEEATIPVARGVVIAVRMKSDAKNLKSARSGHERARDGR
jgi:hypothetical protein